MPSPENEYQKALRVLNEHYTALADQMAQDILEHKEDFESPGFGGDAENIVEKYARRIQQLGSVYSILRWKAHREKPDGKVPLGRYDFRCFGCGGVIQSTEDYCHVCGWTWR
jgi:hypothetical protein